MTLPLRRIPTSTPPTPTTHTLHDLPLLQLLPGHATDARAIEVRLLRLYAPQAAQVLVALLLPLCDERGVAVAGFEEVGVERRGDCGARVVEVVDVAGACERGWVGLVVMCS